MLNGAVLGGGLLLWMLHVWMVCTEDILLHAC